MKLVLLACIFGLAASAPLQMYMEFDIHHAPPEAAHAIPAGVPLDNLDVLLPVDDQKRLLPRPVRGFIKQEIPQPDGLGSKDVYFAFGFDQPAPAPAAPAAPAAPVAPAATVVIAPAAPAAPVVPVAPAAPVQPVKAAPAAPAAKQGGDSDDDDDDD